MLFWIIRQTIISIILIISVHYIYIFFKNNLTIPKTKDLVKKPKELYKDIYSTMNNTDSNKKEDMKNELRNYIGTLKGDKNNEKEEISSGFQNDNYFNWDNNDLNNEDDDLTMDLTSRIK